MKQLTLVRHAAAEPEQFPARDFDRALSDAGLEEVKKLGAFMNGKGLFPGYIACSSANRTQQTASLLKEISGSSALPITAYPLLYNAGFQTLLDFLRNFSNEFHDLMLVAHNPGISQLATVLSGAHPYQFSTSSGLCLKFDAQDWKDLQNGSGKEIWYFNP
jgi:phosphohistidine phosphatase